jgi:hypothetical protein
MRSIVLCVALAGLSGCMRLQDPEGIKNELESLRLELANLSNQCVTQGQLASEVDDLSETVAEMRSDVTPLQRALLETETALGQMSDTLETIQSSVIATDTTWQVGPSSSEAVDLVEAFEKLASVSVLPGAILTLQVETGTYLMDQTLTLNHPDGARIHIVGDDENPRQVVLSFTGGDVGVEVSQAHALGLFSGFTVQGRNTEDTLRGVQIWEGSSLRANRLIVEQWTQGGVLVSFNGSLYMQNEAEEPGLEVAYNDGIGLGVHWGGYVWAQGMHAHDNARGVEVAWNGSAQLAKGLFEDNDSDGFTVLHGAAVSAGSSVASNNGGHGFEVGLSAYGGLSSTVSTNNTAYGYHAYYGGILEAQSSAASNNQTGYGVSNHGLIQAWGTTVSGNDRDFSIASVSSTHGENQTIVRD